MDATTDDFSDLDSSSENDDPEDNFTKATKHVQKIAGNLDSTALLTLYGYYKQGTEGKCNIPKPGFLDVKGKSKWEQWKKLGEMTKPEARKLYVGEVSKIDPQFYSEKSTSEKSNRESWVTVSTPQKTNEKDDCCLIDYIKSSDFEKVEQVLKNINKRFTNPRDCHNFVKLFNCLDEDGLGLLHWAADRGCPKILDLLLTLPEVQVNGRDRDGQTALHYAVSVGHEECVKSLLKNGADPFIKDDDGCDCFSLVSDNTIIKNLLDEHLNIK